MAIYTIIAQAIDGSEVMLSLSDQSPGFQVDYHNGRMTGAQIKAATDTAPGSVAVKMFDNQPGLPVLSVSVED